MEPSERRFNPHNNVTADGVVITKGLRVFTNEMEVATVIEDQDVHEFGCCSREKCADWTTHHETPGQLKVSGGWFSDHTARGALCDEGCFCNHDHWFQVSTKNGTKAFNGERLATRFEGKRAEDA